MVIDKYQEAASILEKITFNDSVNSCEAIFCKLHDLDHLGVNTDEDDGMQHNCLACQLNEGNERIHRFLTENDTSKDAEYSFTIFILLMYLQAEKLSTIFKIIGLTYEYVELNWSVLTEIRKWANFIKHPKGFLFTHHPSFILDSDEYAPDGKTKVIDNDFVSTFYKREDEARLKENIKQLKNKSNILVILPCPARITKEYSKVCSEFCDKIKNNPHFQEILKTHSTALDY